MFDIAIQNNLQSGQHYVPSEEKFLLWSGAVLGPVMEQAELTLRITDESEMITLNKTYRNKDSVTNVLSFPMDIPEEFDLPLLGDIVICAAVVNQQAIEQNKSEDAHWAHMVIHGILHLLGYDHINDDEADEMESKEIELLKQLGYSNPYSIMDNK